MLENDLQAAILYKKQGKRGAIKALQDTKGSCHIGDYQDKELCQMTVIPCGRKIE